MIHNLHVRRVGTVKVKSDNDLGYMLINEADFDEKVHKLFKEKSAKKPKTTEPEKQAE